ncbi:MAG: exodeoxyribonuclease VII small subunit [Candidatus Eiseniibacteriota bacterium]
MPRGKKPAAGERVREGAAPGEPLLGPDGKPYTFEKALDRLEEIVDRLEDGSLALEESLARFEEGVKLTRFLEGELTRAQKRVEELVEDAGGGVTTRRWTADTGELADEVADEELDDGLEDEEDEEDDAR